MNKNLIKYNDLLNNQIMNILPFPEAFKSDVLRFDNPDGETWFLNVNNKKRYHVSFRNSFNTIWELQSEDLPDKTKPLFIFDKVNANQADKLMGNSIEFIDKCGNAYLNMPESYIFVSAKKKVQISTDVPSSILKGYSNKIFKIAGVKLIYAIFTDPYIDSATSDKLLNATMRNLAEVSGIALGSVSGILREMIKQGYIIEEHGERYLLNRLQLFRNWMTGFLDYRTRWNVVHLQSSDPDWWRKISLKEVNIFWGEETAAHFLTKGFLIPEKTTIYTNELFHDFALSHDLHRVEQGGNVELIDLPPGQSLSTDRNCVHPLLVYADLIYSERDRNREAAERIYDLYLKSIIEPD